MKILFLTEQFPYPLHDGGNLRTYHILCGLAREHEVWLLAHRPPEGDEPPTGVLSGDCHIDTVVELSIWRRGLSSCLRGDFRRYPLFVLKNWSPPLLSAARTLHATHSFDAIHFNHLDTAAYDIDQNWRVAKVFDSHNCLSQMARQVSRTAASAWKRSLFARESRKLHEVERVVCDRMDYTLVCSEQDRRVFTEINPAARLVIAPNGVDTAYFRPDSQGVTEPGNLVFTGAMDYYPNEQAAIYFCNEILPELAESNPEVRVHLVGRNPTSRVKALGKLPSVVVTGRVGDVRPYLSRAQVVVVPLQYGSGTRLKILEAFAMGKAVVSTSLGTEGIPATYEREILLADDPSSFREQVRRVLGSEKLRKQLGQAARRLVEDRFDWACVQETVLGVYRSLAGSAVENVDTEKQAGVPLADEI